MQKNSFPTSNFDNATNTILLCAYWKNHSERFLSLRIEEFKINLLVMPIIFFLYQMLTYKSYSKYRMYRNVLKFFQTWKIDRLYFTTIPSFSRHFPRCHSIVESRACVNGRTMVLFVHLYAYIFVRVHIKEGIAKGKDKGGGEGAMRGKCLVVAFRRISRSS